MQLMVFEVIRPSRIIGKVGAFVVKVVLILNRKISKY